MRDRRALVEWSLALLPVAGALLRLWQYARSGSFWLDEVWLATNVVERPWSELLGQPLAFHQGAPPAFLALSKLVAVLLAADDWALRLPPLVCGLATPVLGYFVARLVFRTTAARVALVGALAFSPALVYYASEFKQFSGDVLVTLALVALALRARSDGHGLAPLAVAGALAPWLSHAAPLVLFGLGAALVGEAARGGRRVERVRLLAVLGLVWSASCAALFAAAAGALARDEFMASFWSAGFAPLSGQLPAWLVESALGLTHLAFLHAGASGVDADPAWYGVPVVLLTAVVIVGLAGLGRCSRRLQVSVLLVLGATLCLSAARVYPLRGRLILFLVPLVHVAAASAVEWLARREGARRAAELLAAALVLGSLGVSLRSYPWPHAGMEGALRFLASRAEPGDGLVVDAWSAPALRFYAPRVGLPALRPTAPPIPDDADPAAFRGAVCRAARDRTWVLITRLDLHYEGLERLERDGLRLDGWSGQGTGLALVDLSAPAACVR